MSFDIANLHIDEHSPEGRAIEAIVNRDQVTPEEAVRRALRIVSKLPQNSETPSLNDRPGPNKARRGPRAPNLDVAERLSVIGMFADKPEFSAAMDEVVASRAERYTRPS